LLVNELSATGDKQARNLSELLEAQLGEDATPREYELANDRPVSDRDGSLRSAPLTVKRGRRRTFPGEQEILED